jgi:predicted RNase H-like HicB family nuclease
MQFLRAGVVATLFLAFTMVTTAHASPVERFEGVFKAGETLAEMRAQADQAIEEAVADRFFLVRSRAKQYLREPTEPCGELRIEVEGDEVGITCDDRVPAVSPIDGTQTDFVHEDGQRFGLVQGIERDRLVQEMGDSRGIRRKEFRLSPDGTELQVDVSIRSPRLDRPIEYTHTLKRAG